MSPSQYDERLMIGSDNEECFVEMRMISGSGYTELHIGCTNEGNIVTGDWIYCTTYYSYWLYYKSRDWNI